MQRLKQVENENANGRTAALLARVEDTFGMVPNTARVMANSPHVLESFLAFSDSMSGSSIGDKLHNQLKLATSESNSCDYCTSILCAIGPTAGLTADDILDGRRGNSEDERADAALKFGRAVLSESGKVSDEAVRAIRDAGFHDGEIVEIVASVVLGCFTNFLNNVADTEIDVPRAEGLEINA